MPRMIASDCGCRGRDRMSSCQGLSFGKTCSGSRILSASGVSNSSGRVTVGWSAARPASATDTKNASYLDNHDLDVAGAQAGDDLRIQLVVGDDAMDLV